MARLVFVVLAIDCFLGSISVADETKGNSTVTIGNIKFSVAAGLTVERVADESLIQWPIAATYDLNNDILVLECHWIKESVQKQLESKPHKIVRLSDSDADGTLDQRRVIADGLGFPEGIMVLGKDLLVTAPPQILKLSDLDGDGYFETKETWFDAATLTHCANDLHGPMMGPDGWVYWTKGAFAEQKHALIDRANPGKQESKPSKAAHIYRRHPQGGPIERLMTGGMDNPSDLTFSPEGERFFCSTFMHHPGNGLRDGIGHAPRGGLFGKQHQVLEGHWTTGPLLQPIANLGPAAPASVNYLESNDIAYSTNWHSQAKSSGAESRFLVSSQFNLHKVGLHRLVPSGSSFETESHDLLSADRVDFHPVDILEEPDGDLLVFDTGGWYDLCCPSSGTDQKVAMGGIYRIKCAGPLAKSKAKAACVIEVPNASKDDRQRFDGLMQVASERSKEVSIRKKAMWRIASAITDSPNLGELRNCILSLLGDSDSSIQQTAANIVSLHRWKKAILPLEEVLKSDHPAAVRAAMEALGVVGESSSVEPILAAMLRFPNDRMISHSGIYALMEIGDVDRLTDIAVNSASDQTRYSSLYALNQLGKVPESLLPRLIPCLAGSHEMLRFLAIECLTKSSTGVSLCVPFLERAWETEDAKTLAASLKVVQSGRSNAQLIGMVGNWLKLSASVSKRRQEWLLACLEQTAGDRMSTEWAAPLASWIGEASNETLLQIAVAIRRAKFSYEDRLPIGMAIRARAESAAAGLPELATTLIAASPSIPGAISGDLAKMIVEQLTSPEGKFSNLAEAALAKLVFTAESARSLIAVLDQVPPLYLQTTMNAILRCSDPDIDRELLERLRRVSAIKTLAVEKVLASVNDRSTEVKKEWAAMMQAAIRPPEDIARELAAWLQRLPPGDPKRGYQVFSNAKAACSSCHQIGYVGGRLGPELSSIGRSRTRRDLVEAIVYPSLRIAQGYYPVRIRTVDDEVFNGLLFKQTEEYVELLCGADKICRIEKSQIEEQGESKQSVMPSGLEQQIGLEDFADLLAFLESKR